VTLCNDCHEGIHDAATKLMDAEAYSASDRPKQTWTRPDHVKRADILIRAITLAEETVAESPNRPVSFQVTLSARENRALIAAARRAGMGKAKFVKALVTKKAVPFAEELLAPRPKRA